MKKKNTALVGIMLAGLLCAVALAFLLDPGILTAIGQPAGEYAIVISEICAKNETVITDNSGVYRDYIELYNQGEGTSLSGFRLTDGSVRSEPLGDIWLGSGEYRVIFLGSELTGFALSASGGDSIQLQDPAGRIVAQTKVSAMTADQVMLYSSGMYVASHDASPGFSNDAQGLAAFREGRPASAPRLVISELLIRNASAFADEKGLYSDVAELHNTSSEPIQLGTYTLSDSLDQRFRYRLPDMVIPADGYVVIHCDGENYISQDGHIHANFGLTQGEQLCLTDSSGAYVTLGAEYAGEDISKSLVDGKYEKIAASLGYPNTEEGIYLAEQVRIDTDAKLVISEVLLSSSGVAYEGAFYDVVEILNRSNETVSTKGWYLSDGGDPYRYPLPEQSLAPGELLVVTCSSQTTGFSLSEGETVRLTAPNYLFAPPVFCVESEPGQSISLQSGAEISYDFGIATPGYANTEAGLAAYAESILTQGLRISEVMTNNASYLRGPYGEACDWVELFNGSSETIDLSDYCLSDDPQQLDRCALPAQSLAPGAYCIVVLTRTPEEARPGYPVADLALSTAGDALYLSTGGRVQDFVILPELARNAAYGRAGGSAQWSLLSSVTVGKSNGAAAQVSRTPETLTAQGTYDDVPYLDVVLSGAGEIYYTTDCTVPTRNSACYTGPIRITETTVLRVACYESGKSRSQILDLTYILNENDNLSVVSLVTHPDNLWGYSTGIYAWGAGDYGPYPFKGANFWQDWEKKTTVSLFETDGSVGFSTTCGLKIFGGYSRTQSKKSLACMFRDTYGDPELNYPLFGEEGLLSYESFVLRAGGQDVYNARMRDEMITSLASEHLQIPVQKFRPVVVYLNGRYWGIYYIREKLNDQYVAGNFNVSPEEVSIGEWTGDYCPEYQQLRRWARSHDMTVQENYDALCQMVNLQNYMDYLIAQMWIGNSDNGNVKFFKTTEHPWHWILFDTDQSFRDPMYNSVAEHLKNRNLYTMDTTSSTLILKLLPNEEFKEMFIRRIAWQVNNVWTQENITARIDEIAAMLQPDLAKDCQRWSVRYSLWESSVEHLRKYARVRNDYFIDFVQKYFRLTDSQMREYGFEV